MNIPKNVLTGVAILCSSFGSLQGQPCLENVEALLWSNFRGIALSLSGDGQHAFGGGLTNNGSWVNFLWSGDSSSIISPTFPYGSYGWVSQDGGFALVSTTNGLRVWNTQTQQVYTPSYPPGTTIPYPLERITTNGHVIGTAYLGPFPYYERHVFRWVPGSGASLVGNDNNLHARSASADGSVIIASVYNGSTDNLRRWTSGSNQWQQLPGIPGDHRFYGGTIVVSPNGNYVAGNGDDTSGQHFIFRWTPPSQYMVIPASYTDGAVSVTDLGAVYFVRSTQEGMNARQGLAPMFVWDGATVRSLYEVFANHGITDSVYGQFAVLPNGDATVFGNFEGNSLLRLNGGCTATLRFAVEPNTVFAGQQVAVQVLAGGIIGPGVDFSWSPDGVNFFPFATGVPLGLGRITADWVVPYVSTNNAWVKVESGGATALSGPFTIIGPAVTVTSPQVGNLLIAGESDTIRWTSAFVNSVAISYSTNYVNGGGTFHEIVANHPANTSYYIWDIPDTILSRKCAIRIQDASNASIGDTSSVFRIKGYELTRIDADSNYERFTFGEDRWSFGNAAANMWPSTWWSQFNYQTGIDPYTGAPYPTSWPFGVPFTTAVPDDFSDWPLFVRAFGVDQCYWSTSPGIYKSVAKTKWGGIKNIWAGSCFGFAISSLLSFDRKDQFRTRYPEIPDFAGLFSVPHDTSVSKVINELWIHQFGKQHMTHTQQAWAKTPTQSLMEIKQALLSDIPDHGRLAFRNNGPGGGGHAIVAHRVRQDEINPNIWWIHVYDNSHHNNANAWIKVDTSSNGGDGLWTYGLWPGWGGSKWLYLGDPASTYLTAPILSAITPTNVREGGGSNLEIYGTTRASVVITDQSGNTLGYSDSLVLDGIPGSLALIPETGSMTPPYGYILPDGQYSITLDDFADSVAQVSIFTDSTVVTYRRSDATPNQTDRFVYDGGFALRNTDTARKEIIFSSIIIEDTTSEKVYHVANCMIDQNDSLRFETVNHDDLKVVNVGVQKAYDLYLNVASATVNQRFDAPGISLDANSSHYIVPGWINLQTVPIYIDLGNNGTIDDTLIVYNTVDVDDQGWLDVPKEFHLAQNYPNPFNPSTTIRYSLPTIERVSLKVFNLLGQEVATLVDEQKNAGVHTVQWNAAEVASGIYLYKLQAGGYRTVRKMIVVK